jgi:hypothetical protein
VSALGRVCLARVCGGFIFSVCIFLQFSYKFCEENKIILIWNLCIRVHQIYTGFREFLYCDTCWFRACDFSRRVFLPTRAPFLIVCCHAIVFRHRSAVAQDGFFSG